jgi:nicotinate phosphoribosyltransferase
MLPIIKSLLEEDFYKFSMAQCVLHHFPTADVEYAFKCRNKDVKLGYLAEAVKDEIHNLCNLSFTNIEIEYLKTIPFLKKTFIEFLRCIKLNESFVTVKDVNGDLDITVKGPWFATIWFEIPILAIVNELYFRQFYTEDCMQIARNKLYNKIEYLKANVDHSFKLADFGLRRRWSGEWHDEIILNLKEQLPDNFIGTSDVLLAMKHNVKSIGTFAHEWVCAGQNLGPRLIDSQKFMLQKWCDEYRGDLGIALSDTLGFKAFLNDFDLYFANLFSGCRHDSGDPFIWLNDLLQHYKKLGIDSKTKIAVFSDGLNVEKAVDIWKVAKADIKTTFGIGTNLTNDILNTPLNIVMKLTKVNGYPVAKLSDSAGKCMCTDDNYVGYLKSVFGIK